MRRAQRVQIKGETDKETRLLTTIYFSGSPKGIGLCPNGIKCILKRLRVWGFGLLRVSMPLFNNAEALQPL